jgi:hypothetical protein
VSYITHTLHTFVLYYTLHTPVLMAFRRLRRVRARGSLRRWAAQALAGRHERMAVGELQRSRATQAIRKLRTLADAASRNTPSYHLLFRPRAPATEFPFQFDVISIKSLFNSLELVFF